MRVEFMDHALYGAIDEVLGFLLFRITLLHETQDIGKYLEALVSLV